MLFTVINRGVGSYRKWGIVKTALNTWNHLIFGNTKPSKFHRLITFPYFLINMKKSAKYSKLKHIKDSELSISLLQNEFVCAGVDNECKLETAYSTTR